MHVVQHDDERALGGRARQEARGRVPGGEARALALLGRCRGQPQALAQRGRERGDALRVRAERIRRIRPLQPLEQLAHDLHPRPVSGRAARLPAAAPNYARTALGRGR
jgi:hypothetical protein